MGVLGVSGPIFKHIGRATRFVVSGIPTLLILGPPLLILGPPLSILGPTLLILEPTLVVWSSKWGLPFGKKQRPSRLLIRGLSRINNSGPETSNLVQKSGRASCIFSRGVGRVPFMYNDHFFCSPSNFIVTRTPWGRWHISFFGPPIKALCYL